MTRIAKLDRRALVLAIVVEGVLGALAAFGGPHGALGALPWTLQLPGILLVFFGGGEAWFWWRVAGMILIQVALWYAVIAVLRRPIVRRP